MSKRGDRMKKIGIFVVGLAIGIALESAHVAYSSDHYFNLLKLFHNMEVTHF